MTDAAPAPELPIEQPASQQQDADPSETPPVAPEKTEVELLRERHAKDLAREQRRIDNITRRRYEAEAQAKANGDRIAELEQKLAQSASAASKPALEQFRTYDEYVEAVADWRATQKVEAKLQEFRQNEMKGHEQQARDQQHAQAQEAFVQGLVAVEEAGKKAYPDFVEVVTKGPSLGPMVGSLVLQTEKPDAITYYLAKNPDVGLSIASMPPHQAALAIGRLEAQFASRRNTQAPPPPPEVGNNANAAKRWSPDDVTGSTADWIKRRNQQLAKKG